MGISASGSTIEAAPYFFGQGLTRKGEPLDPSFPAATSFGSNSKFTALVQLLDEAPVDTTYIVSLWIVPPPYVPPPPVIPTLAVTVEAGKKIGKASRIVGIPISEGSLISFEVTLQSGIDIGSRGMAYITPA